MHVKARLKLVDVGDGYEAHAEISDPTKNSVQHEPTANRGNEEHHIKKVSFQLNGAIYSTLTLGKYVANNPVIGVRFETLNSGDRISVHWQGITGIEEYVSVTME